jgi:copper chaperone CopZ
MIKQQFRIQGMHCVGCAMTIDGALEDLSGVKSASTSYAKAVVDIHYDEKQVTEQQLIEAVRRAGYQVVQTN